MNQMKRLATLFVFCLFIAVVMYQPARGHKVQPVEVYHTAWQLVKDNYYDASFNGVKWAELEHRFDNRIRTVDDAHKSIKEMLLTLKDPYTRFLDPRAFQDENDAIDAKIVGIGINLQLKDKRLIITRTIEDGPAERAGIRAGDEIVEIDSANSVGITPEQAAERIRGEIGTKVDLSVKHSATAKVSKVTIMRREITIKSVSTKMLDGNIGYIQLVTFISNDAAREFRQALKKLAKADGIVIDLRDNPGGLLSNALDIADMLLEKGPIVSTIGRQVRHTDIATGAPLTHQPLVVLVDEESASASEILASALKDNGRAVLVGTKTYGKGLVQEINKLPGGAAIHITVSRYLTPSGADINKVGVEPDVTVKVATAQTGESREDVQLKTALQYMKEKLANLKDGLRTSSVSSSSISH